LSNATRPGEAWRRQLFHLAKPTADHPDEPEEFGWLGHWGEESLRIIVHGDYAARLVTYELLGQRHRMAALLDHVEHLNPNQHCANELVQSWVDRRLEMPGLSGNVYDEIALFKPITKPLPLLTPQAREDIIKMDGCTFCRTFEYSNARCPVSRQAQRGRQSQPGHQPQASKLGKRRRLNSTVAIADPAQRSRQSSSPPPPDSDMPPHIRGRWNDAADA